MCSLLSHAIENGILRFELTYDWPWTDHSDLYSWVAVVVTVEGTDTCGHPRRMSSDNPERVEGIK